MPQTTVEEILEAVQKLPRKERHRLVEFLQREAEREDQTAKAPAPTPKASPDNSEAQLPPNRDAEMRWLLDHQKFWEQHRGEHIALSGYEMIAVGKTRKEVIAAARQRGIKFPFVQYLPKDEGEWLLGFSNQPFNET